MNLRYQSHILTPLQEEVLEALFHYPEMKPFFLTGGTALSAFYLHHRYSEDLDFFTLEDFEIRDTERIVRDLVKKRSLQWVRHRTGSFFLEIFLQGDPTLPVLKLDFVKDIACHFGSLKRWKNVPIDNLRNMASNKITAIFGRTEVKDFVDLFFLLQKGLEIDSLFEEAKQKDGGLNEFYFAGQLRNIRHFERLPSMILPLHLEDLQKFFLDLSDRFVDRAKPEGKRPSG